MSIGFGSASASLPAVCLFRVFRAVFLATAANFVGLIAAQAAPVGAAGATAADFLAARPSEEARFAMQRVLGTADHHGQPFAIVDKRDARLYVFDRAGRLVGQTAVLLGATPGDGSAAEVGKHAQSHVPTEERTTPAGRFEAQPGRNLKGEAIVWVDYSAAFAIHRLRPSDPRERRVQRLASPSPDDNRVSLGCVVVPVAFYEQVVQPTLGRERSVVYVLPEARSVREMFREIEAQADPS